MTKHVKNLATSERDTKLECKTTMEQAHPQKVDNNNNTSNHVEQLWELPDVILFHIVSFVAPPTLRATVFCHQLAVLCKEAKRAILEDSIGGQAVALWDTILKEDYGINTIIENDDGDGCLVTTGGHNNARGGGGGGVRRQRRACKRLRRTPVQKVRDAHGA